MRSVYVRIDRPEGYEDVCGELVIEDARIRLPHEDVSEEIATLEAELKERGEEASRLRFTLGALVLSGKLDDVTAREVREPGEKLKAQMDALEAENERLREVLASAEVPR